MRHNGAWRRGVRAAELSICMGNDWALRRERWFEAAHAGDRVELARLAGEGANLDWRERGSGPTALCVCSLGLWSLASCLARWGADPNIPDASGRSPLMLAVGSGSLSLARELLWSGADPAALDSEGRDALGHCRHGGELGRALIGLLLPRSGKRSAQAALRRCALGWGSVELAQALVEAADLPPSWVLGAARLGGAHPDWGGAQARAWLFDAGHAASEARAIGRCAQAASARTQRATSRL